MAELKGELSRVFANRANGTGFLNGGRAVSWSKLLNTIRSSLMTFYGSVSLVQLNRNTNS